MSRSRVRFAVFVAADQVAGRGSRGEALEAPFADAAELEALLAGFLSTGGAGTSVRVMLSQSVTYFATVPWSDALLDDRRAGAYLRSVLEAAIGEAAGTLRIGSEDAAYGETRTACGVEARLVEAIERAAAAAKARIEWLGPWLTPAWERARARVDARDGWYVAGEQDGFYVAAVRGGRITEVSVENATCAPETVRRHIRRLQLREGLDAELPVWLADAAGACADMPGEWKSLPWPTPARAGWMERIMGLGA